MVGKGFIGIMLSLLILLAAQPLNASDAATRAFEKYDMDNLPPQDQNGNYTLDEDDEWTITGQGFLEGNITMFEESTVIIDSANITVNGTIWAKDNSKITITSSVLTVLIPMPGPVLVAEQYDNPNGFVLIEDEASLSITESSIYLERHDIDQIPPEGMMVPIEVFVNFGTLLFDDTYLNTVGTISVGTFQQNITRGIVFHMNCEFSVMDSNLTSGIVFYVNAHGSICNTSFRSVSMQKNTAETSVVITNSSITHSVTIDEFSNAIFSNCHLDSAFIVKGWSRALLYNSTIQGLVMYGNATLTMDSSHLTVEPLRAHWNHIWDYSDLTLLNSSFVRELSFHDNSSLTLMDSAMNCSVLAEYSNATLLGSIIHNLSAEDNASVWLQNSKLESFQLDNYAKVCNITILTVNIRLNEQPLQIPVSIKDHMGQSLGSSVSNEKGQIEFSLIRDMIIFNKTTNKTTFAPQITFCTVEVDWETMHREEGVDIEGDYIGVELEFEDYNPPAIDNVQFSADPFLNTDEDVLTSVYVEEGESSIKHVILKYSIDDGITWKNLTMYNTGGNIYENSIPGQADGTKVRFYIIAEDRCGNAMESQYFAYTTGEGLILVNNLIVIIAFIVVFGIIMLMASRALLGKSRVKKYLHRPEK